MSVSLSPVCKTYMADILSLPAGAQSPSPPISAMSYPPNPIRVSAQQLRRMFLISTVSIFVSITTSLNLSYIADGSSEPSDKPEQVYHTSQPTLQAPPSYDVVVQMPQPIYSRDPRRPAGFDQESSIDFETEEKHGVQCGSARCADSCCVA